MWTGSRWRGRRRFVLRRFETSGFTIFDTRRRPDSPTQVLMHSRSPRSWRIALSRCRLVIRMRPTRENAELLKECLGAKISVTQVEAATLMTASMFEVLAPEVGFEPTTLRLTAGCSTVELLRNKFVAPAKM